VLKLQVKAAFGGIVAALLAAGLLWSYLKRLESETSGGPPVRVLTVVRTIEAGSVLRESDIGERVIPEAYVESRMIRSVDRTRIANLRLSTSLDAQQVINWTDIASTTDERVMSSLVQPGMRAVTIHTEGHASSLVRPGDRVDVIATLPQPGASEHRTGIVLFQNVLVLGRSTSPGGGDASEIALSLSLQHAQLLAVAGDRAKLAVALRSADDVRVQEGLAEVSSQMLVEGDRKSSTAPSKLRSGPIAIGAVR